MSQQLFDEIADALAPSTIDVDGIIHREKRRRAARRAGLLTGVVALTGVLAAGWAIGAAPAPARTPDRAVQAPASSATSPEDGFRLVDNTKEEAATTAKRLSDAMDKALHRVAPDARWIYAVSYATEVEPGPDGQPPRIDFRDVDWYEHLPSPSPFDFKPDFSPRPTPTRSRFRISLPIYDGGQGVEVYGRKGSLKLTIQFATAKGDKFGEFVQSRTSDPWPGEKVPPMERFVSLKLADGRILTLTLGNINGHDIDPAPLTSEQLIAIATELAGKIQP